MAEPQRDTDASGRDSDETREPLPVAEAAVRLGLSIDALRMRVRRGTVPTMRVGGKTYVLVARSVSDETRRDADATPTGQPAATADLVAQLRSEITYLRSELDARTEETRRLHHLLAGVIERLPELPAGTPVTAAEPRTETPVPRPPWWRRLLGR